MNAATTKATAIVAMLVEAHHANMNRKRIPWHALAIGSFFLIFIITKNSQPLPFSHLTTVAKWATPSNTIRSSAIFLIVEMLRGGREVFIVRLMKHRLLLLLVRLT